MDSILPLLVDPAAWIALVTLIVMEVVLGIDNLIFIAILVNRLPDSYRDKTRVIGISLALIMRLALLSTIAWLVHVQDPLFAIGAFDFSIRDLILIAGGLFLLWKSTVEIHEKVDPNPHGDKESALVGKKPSGFASAVVQIIIIDMVFSVNSILTAVGMTGVLPIMVVAVVVAVLLMLVASGPLADFIGKNPTIVMLALGFLLMIGAMLIADGFGFHIPRAYIYAAMGFSAFVEMLNMAQRKRDAKVGDN